MPCSRAPWPDDTPLVQGIVGAECDQYARSRASFTAGLLGRPVGNSNLMGRAIPWPTYGDASVLLPNGTVQRRSAQVFTDHPRIVDSAGSSNIGIEVSYVHLPGRVPPAGWDGEMGAMAPTGL